MGKIGNGSRQNMEGKSNRDDQKVEKIFANHIPIKDLYIKNDYYSTIRKQHSFSNGQKI